MDNAHREGCHPKLSNMDIEEFEAGRYMLNEPICVKVISNRPQDKEKPVLQPIRPVLGNIVERKPKAPVPPSAPRSREDFSVKDLSQSLEALSTASVPQPKVVDVPTEAARIIASMTEEERTVYIQWINQNLSESSIQFLKNRKPS